MVGGGREVRTEEGWGVPEPGPLTSPVCWSGVGDVNSPMSWLEEDKEEIWDSDHWGSRRISRRSVSANCERSPTLTTRDFRCPRVSD